MRSVPPGAESKIWRLSKLQLSEAGHEQKLSTYLTHVSGTSVDMIRSKKVHTDNTPGYCGVYWIHGEYVAKIVFQKKAYYLGTFNQVGEAARVRMDTEKILFDGATQTFFGKAKIQCGSP